NQVLADLQDQTVQQRQEEVEDAIEAREQEEFVGDPHNLSNSDEQALDNFIWGNVFDHEQSNIDFLLSEADDRVYIDDLSILSDEDIYADHVSHEDIENECAENNNDNTFKSNSLADNLKNVDSPMFENAPTTIAETLLMVMIYAMKHTLTWTAFEDTLKLFNTSFGQYVLPHPKYAFNKIFGTTDSMTFHFYCTDYHHYLGKYEGHLTKKLNKTNSNLMCSNPKCQKNARCQQPKRR
ncbi:hypothetical protein AVEN_206309-1, partial [Araneus ventricosus]